MQHGDPAALSGAHGAADPMAPTDPMAPIQTVDKQIDMHMGQPNVKRWIDDSMPLLTGDGDPSASTPTPRPTSPLR